MADVMVALAGVASAWALALVATPWSGVVLAGGVWPGPLPWLMLRSVVGVAGSGDDQQDQSRPVLQLVMAGDGNGGGGSTTPPTQTSTAPPAWWCAVLRDRRALLYAAILGVAALDLAVVLLLVLGSI